jgi:SulP family sulfate permease
VLRRAALPHTAVLGLRGGTPAYRDVEQHEDLQTTPGLIVYRFDAPLFFANADLFRDELLRLVHDAAAPVRQVIVNAEAIYDIDTTGIRMLERLHDDLAAESVRLGFARPKSKPRRLMRATGLEERIGSENFWLRVEDGASAFAGRRAGG